MKRFADLVYTDEELEQDALHYLKTQIYEPSYVKQVKDFISEDVADFKLYFDDEDYLFYNLYNDDYITDYEDDGETVEPIIDYESLAEDLSVDLNRFDMSDDEIDRYSEMLEAEFKKNAYCSHMEPYFLGYDQVVATVVAGYSQDAFFSIYSMVREWAMALHYKKLNPEQMRKYGYEYQVISEDYHGKERLQKLMEFREKNKDIMRDVGAWRAVHSSVFAYSFLYIKSIMTGEEDDVEDYIIDACSSQIFMLLQGESVLSIDFPMVKYALKELKNGRAREMFFNNGAINWSALYDFAEEVIKNCGGIGNVLDLGVDGIMAKSIASYWNKSQNMQKMLKILRQLAMNNSDPVFNQLIQMCEYRLGRPTSDRKKRMENFLEYTRRLMAAKAYENNNRTRTMAQEFVALFPSVFYVYFQWHHNFRNVWPKYPVQAQKKKEEIQVIIPRRQAEAVLTNKLKVNTDRENSKIKEIMNQQRRLVDEDYKKRQDANNPKSRSEAEDKMKFVFSAQDKEKQQRAEERQRQLDEEQKRRNEDRQRQDEQERASRQIIEKSQQQNAR